MSHDVTGTGTDRPRTLLGAGTSALVAIHLQERLVPTLCDGAQVVARVAWLARAARRIGVPVLALELNPEGLGPTVPELREWVPADGFAAGMRFDCGDIDFARRPGGERRQLILAGAEAHVCVLQLALTLRERGRDVYVAGDAIASRRAEDRAAAIERLRVHGVTMVTREMVVFEWLGRGGTPLFREVNREFLRAGAVAP